LILSCALSAQGSQSLPVGFDVNPGTSSSSYPFNTTADHKWQWHYDSGQFEMDQPILITEVYVRTVSSAGLATFDFPSVELLMASSPTDYQVSGHDPIFDNNLNPDATIVRAAAPFTGTNVPALTWMPFGLDEPFYYDPTLGDDFILQIRKCSTISTWGQSIDGVTGSSGAVGGNRYGHLTDCSATSHSFNNDEFVPTILIDWIPTGPSMEIDPMIAGELTDFRFDYVDPGGQIFISWSLAGAGPTVLPFGDLMLSEPINRANVVHADANGSLNFSTYIPLGLAGETFYCHTVVERDGGFEFTNPLEVPVQ
jgi:hypothetical protein